MKHIDTTQVKKLIGEIDDNQKDIESAKKMVDSHSKSLAGGGLVPDILLKKEDLNRVLNLLKKEDLNRVLNLIIKFRVGQIENIYYQVDELVTDWGASDK